MWVLSAFPGQRPHPECLCVGDVSRWTRADWLQLNHSKTEVLWCASAWRQHVIPTGPVHIGSTQYCQCRLLETLKSTLTLTSTWRVTSPTPWKRVSQRCVMLCWPLSVLSWSAKSTTASLFSLVVFTEICRIVHSRYMTTLGLCVQLGSQNITPLLWELHWLRVPDRYLGPVMFSGILLCTRHSASLPSWQSPAHYQCPSTPSSAFHRHHDDARATDATFHPRRPTGHSRWSVAAARAWNELPPATRAAAFPERYKSILFRSSSVPCSCMFRRIVNNWTFCVVHSFCTRFSFNLVVKCFCNVSDAIVTLKSFAFITIIINNNCNILWQRLSKHLAQHLTTRHWRIRWVRWFSMNPMSPVACTTQSIACVKVEILNTCCNTVIISLSLYFTNKHGSNRQRNLYTRQ